MKKLILIVLICFLVLGCEKEKTFYLDDNCYGENAITEIDNKKLKELEKNDASFIIFIYQPMCTTSYNFNNVLTNFSKQHDIELYKITYANIKDSSLAKHIKYFPSVAIYQEGIVATYLDPNKEEDIQYYESVDGFKEWLTQYVLLK